MTTKADYSPEEWQLLIDLPPAVGMAVMVAAGSGLGSLKEAWAVGSGILGARDGFEGNALVGALTQARLKDGERSDVEKLSSPYRGQTPTEIRQDVVDKCSRVARLLSDKSTAEESAGYKQWVLGVGQKVAEAAKEGGFLGIGGERVSAEETEVLAAVTKALNS